ncbi:MAG: hypothetical protein PHQ33_04955 [Bacteroidales bacterium]|nr:hypothetical protein [Bacteroidales bacterium]
MVYGYVYDVDIFESHSLTVNAQSDLKRIYQSRSSISIFANFSNVRQLIINKGVNGMDFHVLRYIDTISLNEMYRERENLVNDYIEFARKKEASLKVGYAFNVRKTSKLIVLVVIPIL